MSIPTTEERNNTYNEVLRSFDTDESVTLLDGMFDLVIPFDEKHITDDNYMYVNFDWGVLGPDKDGESRYESVYIKPSERLRDWLGETMIDTAGGKFLQVIRLRDEHADFIRVFAKYSSIIGSRMLLERKLTQDEVDAWAEDNIPFLMRDLTVEDLIGMLQLEGPYRLRLPEFQIDRDKYLALKTRIQEAGGTYAGSAFFFDKPIAEDVRDELSSGGRINKRKELQQFFTPPEVAKLVEAKAGLLDLNEDAEVLEPNVGRGALIPEGVRCSVTAYELDDDCIEWIEANRPDINVGRLDFMRATAPAYLSSGVAYDRIVMNPPFTKGQDIAHVQHAARFLKKDGRLVAIMGTSWETAKTTKAIMFRAWLDDVEAEVDEIPAGAFKASGTTIETRLVVIHGANLQGG